MTQGKTKVKNELLAVYHRIKKAHSN